MFIKIFTHMKKYILLVFMAVFFLNSYAQDIEYDILHPQTDTVFSKSCSLSEYPHAYDFVYGDVEEVDIWSGIGYVKLSDGTSLVLMEPECVDGIDDLKVSEKKFAVFIINYRNEILRADVVNWE